MLAKQFFIEGMKQIEHKLSEQKENADLLSLSLGPKNKWEKQVWSYMHSIIIFVLHVPCNNDWF